MCYNTIPRSKPTSFFGVLLPPTFNEWYMTTTWRGESPTSSWALTSAPLSKRSLAMVTCLLSTARRRGVCWRPFRRLTSEPGRACNEVAKTWCNNNKNKRLVVQTLNSADHLKITIQRISIGETNCVFRWIETYPMDSVIHFLNNWRHRFIPLVLLFLCLIFVFCFCTFFAPV